MKKLLITTLDKKIKLLFNQDSQYYIKGGFTVLYRGSYLNNDSIILEFDVIEYGNQDLLDITVCLDVNSCITFKNWKIE